MQKSGCSIEMQKITFNKNGQEIMHNQDQIIQWVGLIIVYIYIYIQWKIFTNTTWCGLPKFCEGFPWIRSTTSKFPWRKLLPLRPRTSSSKCLGFSFSSGLSW